VIAVSSNPTAFFSYSWDDDVHKAWIALLATRLRRDGIDVHLDQWDAAPGDQLPQFMEREIRDCDFVMIVCTPKYKTKSDDRTGGSGYEGHIITAETFVKANHRKFIPVLATGLWQEAAPSWLAGKYYVDLSSDSRFSDGYRLLRSTILNPGKRAPRLGSLRADGDPLPNESATREEAWKRLTDIWIHGQSTFSFLYEHQGERFRYISRERDQQAGEKIEITSIGFLDLALVIEGVSDQEWFNNQRFLSALKAAHPNPPGFAIWKVDERSEIGFHSYSIPDMYEQLLVIAPGLEAPWGTIDFAVFDPTGRFFLRKAFIDDLSDYPFHPRGRNLDPVAAITQVSESFVVGSAYAKALGYDRDSELQFRIRWSGLNGRRLDSNFHSGHIFFMTNECRENEVELDLTLPLEPSKEEIIQKTTVAVQSLAKVFGDKIFPVTVVRNEIGKRLF
jgi:TIR domain